MISAVIIFALLQFDAPMYFLSGPAVDPARSTVPDSNRDGRVDLYDFYVYQQNAGPVAIAPIGLRISAFVSMRDAWYSLSLCLAGPGYNAGSLCLLAFGMQRDGQITLADVAVWINLFSSKHPMIDMDGDERPQ